MPIVRKKRESLLDLPLFSLIEVTKDDQIYYVLGDMRMSMAESRATTEEVIGYLRDALDNLTDEDLDYISKSRLLDSTPHMYPQIYGEDDPMWQQYQREHPPQRKVTKHTEGKSDKGFVYIIQGAQYFKIGCTADPYKRLTPMTAHAPFPLETLILIPTETMRATEIKLHGQFTAQHVRGEWFNLTDKDLAIIRQEFQTIDPTMLKAN